MIRSKKYITGEYLEIEIFNVSNKKKKFDRAKKVKESSPAQKKLNSKKSMRYLVRLCNINFTKNDISLDLTCDDDHIPGSRSAMLQYVKNYIARLKYAQKKISDKPIKYVYVISNHKGDDTESIARPHVHMIISSELDRDTIERKWGNGYANSERLQFNEYGITGKALYIGRQSKSVRSWGSSTNLIKPEPYVSDKAITRSQMDRIINDPEDGLYVQKIINKSNKTKWTFTDCLVEYDGRQLTFAGDPGDGNGFSLLIRMRKDTMK